MAGWRNWQTQTAQNRPTARSWGFKSLARYHHRRLYSSPVSWSRDLAAKLPEPSTAMADGCRPSLGPSRTARKKRLWRFGNGWRILMQRPVQTRDARSRQLHLQKDSFVFVRDHDMAARLLFLLEVAIRGDSLFG